MPMVVAKAMDDNKNLVPLYVAVDGDDFPYEPTSPGFNVSLNKSYTSFPNSDNDSFSIVLTATGNNPTGGNLSFSSPYTIWNRENSNYVSFSFPVSFKILNTSKFSVSVTLQTNYNDSNFNDVLLPSTPWFSVQLEAGEEYSYTLINQHSSNGYGRSLYSLVSISVTVNN